MRNINIPWPKFNLFWKLPEHTNMPNLRPFLSCVLKKMPGNRKFGLFHEVKMPPKLGKSRDDGQNLINTQGGQDKSACRISSHSKWLQKKESTLSLMSLQRPNEKKMPKIQICNFGRNMFSLNHLEVSSWKIESCCYNNTDEESPFHIHITWTQGKVKGENLKKLPKFKTQQANLVKFVDKMCK